jgi:peroxiredoxin Q/BCP
VAITGATELSIGDPAPDFRLPASTGGEIGLADYRGRAHVVLFFVREYR